LLAPLVLALAVSTTPAPPASVAALVRRCVEEYGGELGIARSARMVQQGTVTSLLHPGVTGRIARAYRRPGKLRVEIDFGGPPEIRLYDAPRGWRSGEEVRGGSLDAMALQAARLDLPALLASAGGRIEDAGTLDLEGKRLRVLAVAIGPGLRVEAAIDPGSGRILRSRGTRAGTPPLEFTTTYSDFRSVDGVLVPFHEVNFANGSTTGETVLSRVRLPATLPDDLFRPEG
jgi:hypothetical protein